jgi:hypothetical protein
MAKAILPQRTPKGHQPEANEVTILGETAFLHLTRDKFAMIDTADLPLVSQYRWTYQPDGRRREYAVATIYIDGKKSSLGMGRVILGMKRGDPQQADHKDGNGLNNRRSNLRVVTRSQNAMNRRKPAHGTTSQYKGVHFIEKPYLAYIFVKRKRVHLGYFATEREAALAYNRAAMKYHGEFAYLNKIE